MTCDKIQEQFADYLTGRPRRGGRDESPRPYRRLRRLPGGPRGPDRRLGQARRPARGAAERRRAGRLLRHARGRQERRSAPADPAGRESAVRRASGVRPSALAFLRPPAPRRARRGLAHERRGRRAAGYARPRARSPGHAPANGPVAPRPALRHGPDPGRRLHRRGREAERRNARRLFDAVDETRNPNVRLAAVDALYLFRDRPGVRERLVESLSGPDLPSRPGRPHRLPGRRSGRRRAAEALKALIEGDERRRRSRSGPSRA